MMRRLFAVALVVMVVVGMGAGAQETAIPRFTEVITIERGSDFSIPGQWSEQMGFSPDGAYLAAGMAGGVGIWDVATGELIKMLPEESFAVAWSPDGRWLTTGDTYVDGTLRLWDAETGELRGEFNQDGWDAGIYSSWAPDSSRFATDSGQVIDPETGEITMQLGEAWAIPNGVTWSSDGKYIAIPTTWHDTFLHIWSTDSGELVDTYWSEAASWSPDGLRIATDRQIRDVATGLPAVVIPNLYGNIAWSPDGRWIISDYRYGYSSAHRIYAWDPATGELLTTLTIPECWIDGLAWSADGSRLAASCIYFVIENQQYVEGSYHTKIHVWDVDDGGEAVLTRPQESERGNQMPRTPPASVSPDGLRVAFDTGTAVEVYALATGELVESLDGYGLDGEANQWNGDGTQLVVLTRDSDPRHGPKYIWTIGEGLSAPIYNATGQVWWSTDGTQMATVSDYSVLRFYDAATGELAETVRGFPDGEMSIDGVSNETYIVTTHGSYVGSPPPSFAVFNVKTRRVTLTAGMGLGGFRLEGDRLIWTEVGPGGFTMEYDLTGQDAPVRRETPLTP
jgi:WD40 repeat protein